MQTLKTQDLKEVIELLAIAIVADMPPEIRRRIAGRLGELGRMHSAGSPTAGGLCTALADLLRDLPTPTAH